MSKYLSSVFNKYHFWLKEIQLWNIQLFVKDWKFFKEGLIDYLLNAQGLTQCMQWCSQRVGSWVWPQTETLQDCETTIIKVWIVESVCIELFVCIVQVFCFSVLFVLSVLSLLSALSVLSTCNTIQFHAILWNTMQYHAIQSNLPIYMRSREHVVSYLGKSSEKKSVKVWSFTIPLVW